MKLNKDELIKWLATLFIMVPAALISFIPTIAETSIWIFILFAVGHIIWSVYAIRLREWSLLGLNAGFLPIDIWAMLIRI